MSEAVRKSDLSPARQELVGLMKRLHFGRIEKLVICDGEPVWTPVPEITREVKLGSRGSHPKPSTGNYVLKAQVVDLFKHFESLGTTTITCLEIQNGLPFRMSVKDPRPP